MKKGPFKAPHDQSVYFPELESAEITRLGRLAFDRFLTDVKKHTQAFFNHEDDWLLKTNVINPKLTNIEVVSVRIRHLMYHVGRLNRVLPNELGQVTPWIDYF